MKPELVNLILQYAFVLLFLTLFWALVIYWEQKAVEDKMKQKYKYK